MRSVVLAVLVFFFLVQHTEQRVAPKRLQTIPAAMKNDTNEKFPIPCNQLPCHLGVDIDFISLFNNICITEKLTYREDWYINRGCKSPGNSYWLRKWKTLTGYNAIEQNLFCRGKLLRRGLQMEEQCRVGCSYNEIQNTC